MNKQVMVKPTITAQQFGCDRQTFDDHIKGKALPVKNEYHRILLVHDANGDLHTVKRDHIDTVSSSPMKEVSHG